MTSSLRSTLQLLRFHFSFFLMPVYWFALSRVPQVNWSNALLIFVILHLLVYPASNGYNSYMDRDTTPVGGIYHPMQPTKYLFYTTCIMNALACLLSLLISWSFALGIFFYIMASVAYSYRGIRLKKYPIIGYITVLFFQGAVTFFLVYTGSSIVPVFIIPWLGMLAASLLIGGFYPLTQIYQHAADKKDGVVTISALLGYRGTFIFTGIIYALAFASLAWLYFINNKMSHFYLLQIFMLPVLVYFFIWCARVFKDTKRANFENTMTMNIIASACTNIAFIILLILSKY